MWLFMSGWLLQAIFQDTYSFFSRPNLLCICCETTQLNQRELTTGNEKTEKEHWNNTVIVTAEAAPIPTARGTREEV